MSLQLIHHQAISEDIRTLMSVLRHYGQQVPKLRPSFVHSDIISWLSESRDHFMWQWIKTVKSCQDYKKFYKATHPATKYLPQFWDFAGPGSFEYPRYWWDD